MLVMDSRPGTTETTAFGVLLHEHRRAAALSQQALADRAGLSVDAIAALERGRRAAPRQDTVAQLAAALGLATEDRARFMSAAAAARQHLASRRLLIGREREQLALRKAVAGAIARHGALVLISGEAGVGKTALAEAAAQEATRAGALTLVGRCYDLAETPPYGPWSEIREQLTRALEVPAAVGSEAAPNQGALFAEFRTCLAAAAAQRSLILVLEDVHWADRASLDLLRFLGRSLDDLGVLIVATYRTDDLSRDHPLQALVPQLVRDAHAVRLDLRGLTAGHVRKLVEARHRLPPEDASRLVTYLHRQADGNPFFTLELLRALEEEELVRPAFDVWVVGDLSNARVPVLVRQVIDARLARLGPETRQLLSVASVIGAEIPLALWRTVASVTEAAIEAAAEQALATAVLTEVRAGRSLAFGHALVREAVYEGTPAMRRRQLHRQVAEALAHLPNIDPDAVGHHFRLAGDGRAIAWIIRAGQGAQHSYAYFTAHARYRSSLALLDEVGGTTLERAWLLVRIGWVGMYVDPPAALTALNEAVELGVSLKDDALLQAARFVRGVLLGILGQFRLGIADLEALVHCVDERADGRATWDLAMHGLDVLPHEAADPHDVVGLLLGPAGRLDQAARLLAAGTTRDSTEQGLIAGHVASARGDPSAARAALRRARTGYAGKQAWLLVAMAALLELQWVGLPYSTDRPRDLDRLAAEGEEALARVDGIFINLPPRTAHLPLLFLRGCWSEVADLCRPRPGVGMIFAEAGRLSGGELARATGATERAWAMLDAALPDGPDSEPGDAPYLCTLGLLRLGGNLAIDGRDFSRAREWLLGHDRWLAWNGSVLGRAEGSLLWARYYRASGDRAAAARCALQALAEASSPSQPLALLAAHRLLGRLDAEIGADASAASQLHTALELAGACHAPYERALTLLALAECARDGAGSTVQAHLAEARTICEALGALPMLGRANAIAARVAFDGGPC
jgi:transcriptional regulator with XRE-family HTH domain